MIGGEWYCHTFAAQPSCYTQTLREGGTVTNEVLPVRRRVGGPGPWVGDDPAVDLIAVQVEIRKQLAEIEVEEQRWG